MDFIVNAIGKIPSHVIQLVSSVNARQAGQGIIAWNVSISDQCLLENYDGMNNTENLLS